MRETLRTGGVKAVSAPQLFPTPPEIARKMIDAADLQPGLCVLEPSAGTGNLIRPIVSDNSPQFVDTEVLAYEINGELCSLMRQEFPSHRVQVRRADFLEVSDFAGCYPRVLMNPPFKNGEDIEHIRHAMKFLAPGGRLVALCANGPRQQAKLQTIADTWEPLPPGSFKASGTMVNVAMMTYTKPPE